MYRSALALGALLCAFALTTRAADPGEKMAGAWTTNVDNKMKETITIKVEDGKWSVTGVYTVKDKEVGSFKGEDCAMLKTGSLIFKKVYEKKPNPTWKDGTLCTAKLDKDQLSISYRVGKNAATTRYASADAAKANPKANPKADPKTDPGVEAKGEVRIKPENVLAKPGDTVRLLVVADKGGFTAKHVDALKKGKITKLEGGFGGFEEDEQRLAVSDVTDQPKELDLVKGTYRMVVVSDRSTPPMAGFQAFCSVKLPNQCNFTDIKFVGEAKGKFKFRTAEPAEGMIYVVEAKVVKFGK